jgi:hypothetical protein
VVNLYVTKENAHGRFMTKFGASPRINSQWLNGAHDLRSLRFARCVNRGVR